MSLNNQDISYKDVLGLHKDPFSPEPDPAFCYSFDSFEQRLKVLQGLVQGGEILVLVIGEPGSGKTTLLNRYLAAAEEPWKAVRITTDPADASPRTTDTLDREGYPAYVVLDSENPIVIVDDSHKLPQKELEFLLQEALIPGSTNKIKRLVLFGESDFFTRLTRLAETYTAQPAVNKIYLPGLTEEQTGAYLQHRLAAAGYTGKNPFSSSAIKDIHQTSGGFPGVVNEIASQWLRVKYPSQEEGHRMLQQFSAPSRRIAVWIVAGVIVVLLAALWYLPNRKPAADKVAAHKPAPKVFRQKISQDRRPAETVIRKKVTAAPAEIKTPQPPAETSTQPPPAETSTQPPPAETPTGPQPAVTSTQPQPTEASTQPPANIKTKQPAKAETALAETAAAVPIKKESPQKTTVQPAPAPSIAGAPETAGTKTDLRAARREKWLLSQDATAYTIQIMGVHDEQFLLDFIKKYQLLKESEIAYYESTYQGKAWFQLLYGIYPARQEAELAADKLPENIRRAGPWVRRLSTIQKAIRNRGIQ